MVSGRLAAMHNADDVRIEDLVREIGGGTA
jgi:hypothetical protein